MLSDVLHTVAKLQGSLQGKEVDLASVPGMVDSTIQGLKELKENTSSSTWFKDHCDVFTDPSQLGARNIDLTIDNRGGGGIGNACVKIMMMSRRMLVTARLLLVRVVEIHGAVCLGSIR